MKWGGRSEGPDKTLKMAVPKKPTGVRTKAKTTLRPEVPEVAQVFIVGSFNGWDLTANPLGKDQKGIWSCTLAIEPGEHEHRFLVGEVWWDDPTNPARRWNEFCTQNCIFIVEG